MNYYTLEQYKGLSVEQIVWLLEKDYFKKSVPPPRFIVISGQGIVIYWLIEPVPYMALPLWNAVQKFFLEKLKEIGADVKSIDAARVSRLSGTINIEDEMKVLKTIINGKKVKRRNNKNHKIKRRDETGLTNR
ncbi:hypothetical protein [Clostridium estertheticum]|uniref:hypothetical protein n=1 Tax=Clostridium estertheticum TaxID=238834 RepID=UPI001CF0E4EB|nr:hypothetical protein [Clostridium estertheticum]MCB2362282.1 hypothetical protein [Clostridium estertheticum]